MRGGEQAGDSQPYLRPYRVREPPGQEVQEIQAALQWTRPALMILMHFTCCHSHLPRTFLCLKDYHASLVHDSSSDKAGSDDDCPCAYLEI